MRRVRKRWRADPIFAGDECFIYGGGPSLRGFDVERLRGRRVIACNDAYMLAPWFDVAVFSDAGWVEKHLEGLRRFKVLKVWFMRDDMSPHEAELAKEVGAELMTRVRLQGVSIDPQTVSWGGNTGTGAINLAMHFGARRIVLLGFDMRKVGGAHNWHRHHEQAEEAEYSPWDGFLRYFPLIANDLKRLGVECVNASPGSAIDAFPIVSHGEVLGAEVAA